MKMRSSQKIIRIQEQVPTRWDARLSLISLGSPKMLRVAGQVTAIQTGLLDGLLEPYTGGQKL